MESARANPIVAGKNLVVMGYRLTGPFVASRRMVRLWKQRSRNNQKIVMRNFSG
jgi:hypothetical protein